MIVAFNFLMMRTKLHKNMLFNTLWIVTTIYNYINMIKYKNAILKESNIYCNFLSHNCGKLKTLLINFRTAILQNIDILKIIHAEWPFETRDIG